MHTSYISLPDSLYEICRVSLTNETPSVVILDKYNHPMKIELINGRIKSMLNGVMLPVINSTTDTIMREAKSDTNHIEICKQSTMVSKKKAHSYLDKVTTLAYEKGFPLKFVNFSDIPGVMISHVPGVTLEIFNELINRIREQIDNGDFLTPREKYKEYLEISLKKLFDGFRTVVKDKESYDPKSHQKLCCFLRVELDFFLKYKNIIDSETPDHSVAQALKEEYPLAMFNEILMEYFDASMAFSEGKVKEAGDLVKSKYESMKILHSNIS
jgi:hypothetical protein